MKNPKYATLLKIIDGIRAEAPSQEDFRRFRTKKPDDIAFSRGQAFIQLLLLIRFGLETFEERHQNICDGQGDGGLDAYFFSEQEKTVFLVQSKFRNTESGFTDNSIPASDLHSKDPNRFPLTLTELTWRDTRWEEQDWKDEDFPKFAFTCGYLSHMAADRIIHPMVNEIAGPYYRKGESRSIHRECEIYQDVALFHTLYPSEDFMKRKFNCWADISPHSHVNTKDWFRYIIQRAFAECHSVYPREQGIENWVDGLLFTLRIMKLFLSPYRKAYKEYKKKGPEGEKFKKYFSRYMDLFFNAVELTSIYWKALFELYEPTDNVLEISNSMRNRFLNIVRSADLSSPLEKNILQKAKEALLSTDDSRLKRLTASASNFVDRKKVLEIKEEDVGKLG